MRMTFGRFFSFGRRVGVCRNVVATTEWACYIFYELV